MIIVYSIICLLHHAIVAECKASVVDLRILTTSIVSRRLTPATHAKGVLKSMRMITQHGLQEAEEVAQKLNDDAFMCACFRGL